MIRIEQIFSFSILKTFTKTRITTVFVLLLHQQLFAQVADNFSDSDMSGNPTWLGQTDKFTVTNEQLQLQAPPVADVAYLYLESEAIVEASWEFRCQLLFNPSSSNYARIYLVSDQPDLANALNGYYVMLGNTPDEISLYKQTGTTRTKIIDGVDDRLDLTAPHVRVKVTRDQSGNWKLFSDVGITGTYVEEGAVTDNTHIASHYAGILCTYTSTRSDKFYFDDVFFVGDPYVPPPPPAFRDVIISEFMADPTPRQELPEVEYVEIFNRSGKSFSMEGWILSDGSSNAQLPSVEIQPHEYILLCSGNDVAELEGYGKVVGLTSFPSLNNTGDQIILRYKNISLIDSINFTNDWYSNVLKAEGGWSLEKIDAENICGEDDNWFASEHDHGGTPGTSNSVAASKPDVQGPRLISVFAENATTLLVTFHEKLSSTPPNPEYFKIEPDVAIEQIQFIANDLRGLRITLAQSLQIKTAYKLTVIKMYDCAGNNISPEANIYTFAIPESAMPGDLLINEILFNPRPGGVDFLELVNASPKYIDMAALLVGNMENNEPINRQIVTSTPLLLKPGDYLVLTENKDLLKSDYTQTREEFTYEVPTLPTMNDDEGAIAVFLHDGTLLDQFTYSKNLHSPFLQNDEGVSLERISLLQPTQDANNWKSASTQSNYATPGFINSQARTTTSLNGDEVIVSPELFEPVTGQPDFTEIHYQFTSGGYIANVKIVDPQGRVVKELATNELLGTTGSFRWDGDLDNGTKARIGYYMVWLEIFNDKGAVTHFRKRVGVVAKF